MVTSAGALATAVPFGMGIDPQAQKEYTDALSEQLKSLEGRQNINLFKAAGNFFNPGRTGSFGEALGNVATGVGQDVEAQEARALPIAQMRAQIAGQKYELGNQAKAFGLLANAIGMSDPQKAAQALQSGQGLVGIGNKFTPELYTALSTLSPKIAEIVKNAAGMDIDRFKAMTEAAKLNVDVTKLYSQFGEEAVNYFIKMNGGKLPSPSAAGAPASGTTSAKPEGQYDFSTIANGATLTSPMGERNGEAHKGIDLGGMKLGAPVTTPVAGEVVFAGDGGKAGNMVTVRGEDGTLHSLMHFDKLNVKVGDKVDAATVLGGAGKTGNATGVHVHYEAKTADGKPINVMDNFKVASGSTSGVTQDPDAMRLGVEKISASEYRLPFSGTVFKIDPSLPIETRNEMIKAAVANENLIYKSMNEEEIKAYAGKKAELINMRPHELSTQMGDYENLIKYLTKPEYKNVVGALQQKLEGSNETVWGKFMSGLQALGAGGEKGIAAGRLGSVSLPVAEMIRTFNLTERERIAFNEIERIVKSGLISTIAQSGKVLGTNPTDSDRQLFEAASASTNNLAANTIYWAQMRRAQTEFLRDASKGIRQYTGKHPAAYFTSPTSPYMKAEEAFDDNIRLIQSKAPGL